MYPFDRSDMPSDMPTAWVDLLEGLFMLAAHPTDSVSPFNCTHDQLGVMADSSAFTDAELARLDELGFHVDDYGAFYSFRFGSA